MAIEFLIDLVSLQYCVASIDHNDVITGVEKRSPFGTAFARQDRSNLRSEMAHRLATRINHVPFSSSREFLTAGDVCRHSSLSLFSANKTRTARIPSARKRCQATRLAAVSHVPVRL